ncbi:hypothetical protein SERLA73DRAFT_188415 [Serpula lacrymans var. lacrymans S7.3]|uniref:Sucraseferredoxin-like protein n=2 Tax=Serpula lacrymans var. lacrymans TaxID=341189 RepID=F8QBA3_SERL3|nr:uncharacterized protein SERLADRAFT_478515 [Serpula lacrymans var. lacrymans S7.9]EGN94489.1 hypothetical protein SERLA73DRAFT_188415 [Serpula lacrymans var. lacrymans S7.3]EGO19968.1 hypothetical protein SERLADRAFT_478515 [Serpula lacrymans var. lacrymans S7.9]
MNAIMSRILPFKRTSFLRGLTTSSPPPPRTELPGTTPSHLSYIFIHTPQPPSQYPSKYSTPVQRALQVRATKWGGSVGFSWSPDQPAIPALPSESSIDSTTASPSSEQEYYLTAFSSRGRLVIPSVSTSNVEEVESRLREHAQPLPSAAHGHGVQPETSESQDVYIYVCTHGARDCRCGDTGGAVASALREQVSRIDGGRHIKVAEVGHVGGHKYAANVLIYPHGEWLGLVQPEDVPSIVDTVLAVPLRPLTADDAPLFPSHWRGRMGLSKGEQVDLFASYHSSTP